jgi:hypothetical protein
MCKVDSDCAAPLVCYSSNLSWTLGESLCACSTWYGRSGESCHGFTLTGVVLLLSGLTMLLCSSLMVAVASRDLYLTFRVLGRDLRRSATTTLLSSWAAVLSFALWRMCYLGELLDTGSFESMSGQPAERNSSWGPATRMFILLTQLFACLAALNISVMWVELSSSTTSAAQIENVRLHRRKCGVFGGVFTLCMAAAALSGHTELSTLVAAPFLAVLAVLFIVGRLRLLRLMLEAADAAQVRHEASLEARAPRPSMSEFATDAGFEADDSSSVVTASTAAASQTGSASSQRQQQQHRHEQQHKSPADRLRRSTLAIEKTSLRVTIALLLIVVFGMVYFALVALPQGSWKAVAPLGMLSAPTLAGEMLSAAMLYLLASILVYSHRGTHKLISRARQEREHAVKSSNLGSARTYLDVARGV